MNLEQEAQNAYDLVRSVVDKILEQGLENEQWTIDWMDSINEQSVRF